MGVDLQVGDLLRVVQAGSPPSPAGSGDDPGARLILEREVDPERLAGDRARVVGADANLPVPAVLQRPEPEEEAAVRTCPSSPIAASAV